jgi:predicted transcriptional regulator
MTDKTQRFKRQHTRIHPDALNCYTWIKCVQNGGLTPQENHLCHFLLTKMNMDTDIAWPSIAEIVHKTGLSKRTVYRALSSLEEKKWIVRDSGGPKASNMYYTCFPEPVLTDLSKSVVSEWHQGGVRVAPGVVSEWHPNNNTNINLISNTIDHQSMIDAKKTSKKEQKTIDKVNGTAKLDTKLKGFDEFWSIYPRKVGKKPAMKSWKTQGCYKDIEQILEDVKNRAEYQWKGKDQQFVPHPSTFINQRRWEDTEW